MTSRSFADLVAREEPALAPLLLGLASEIARAAATPAEERAIRLDRLAEWIAGRVRRLAGAHSAPPAMRIAAVHQHVAADIIVAGPWRTDTRLSELRPDLVCARRQGHPAVAAAMVAAVAEEAGLPIGLVVSPTTHTLLLAHRGIPAAGAIEFGTGRLLDVDELSARENLQWACGHEVASMLLELIAARSAELGLHPVHVTARTLATHLPLDPQTRRRDQVQLARARAAYN